PQEERRDACGNLATSGRQGHGAGGRGRRQVEAAKRTNAKRRGEQPEQTAAQAPGRRPRQGKKKGEAVLARLPGQESTARDQAAAVGAGTMAKQRQLEAGKRTQAKKEGRAASANRC